MVARRERVAGGVFQCHHRKASKRATEIGCNRRRDGERVMLLLSFCCGRKKLKCQVIRRHDTAASRNEPFLSCVDFSVEYKIHRCHTKSAAVVPRYSA